MKVLFVSEYYTPKIMGGGEINLSLIAKSLAKKGIDVSVLTSHFKGLKKEEDIDGVKVYRRLKTGKEVSSVKDNLIRSLRFGKSVKKEVSEFDVDVIHYIGSSIIASKKGIATIESYVSMCPKGDLLYQGKRLCNYKCTFSRFIRCLLKSPEIGKVKNKFYLKYNPLFWIYLRRYYKKMNNSLKKCNLIAISEFIQKRLAKEGHLSTVIPNIVEVEKFYSKDVANKKVRIVYLGSLTKYKGPQVLLKAAKGLDCRIALYGEGVLKDQLNKLIKENNLDAKIQDNVDYKDILNVYATSDIVVFPSIWPEPFGRITVEAMAAGKPVVVSDTGAIPSIIKDAGVIVSPGNVSELQDALKLLINDKKLRNKLGELGKKYAKEYSSENVINKIIELYKK
jgi:glycosyltransferase involved in cell wall biosynthesis